MKTVSIGFRRDDGDFAVIATFNNVDDNIAQSVFEGLVEHTRACLTHQMAYDVIQVLERQDAPDYVDIDE